MSSTVLFENIPIIVNQSNIQNALDINLNYQLLENLLRDIEIQIHSNLRTYLNSQDKIIMEFLFSQILECEKLFDFILRSLISIKGENNEEIKIMRSSIQQTKKDISLLLEMSGITNFKNVQKVVR